MKVNFHTENYTGCLCDAFLLHPAIHHKTDQRGQHVRQEGTISIWLIFQIKQKQKVCFNGYANSDTHHFQRRSQDTQDTLNKLLFKC